MGDNSNNEPYILTYTISILERHNGVGIFALADQDPCSHVLKLKDKYDKTKKCKSLRMERDPVLAATLLKFWLGMRDRPLFGNLLYDAFLSVIEIENLQVQVHCIKQLLEYLPEDDLIIASRVLKFLNEFHWKGQITTKVELITTIFAPYYLKHPQHSQNENSKVQKIMLLLIENYESIFENTSSEYIDPCVGLYEFKLAYYKFLVEKEVEDSAWDKDRNELNESTEDTTDNVPIINITENIKITPEAQGLMDSDYVKQMSEIETYPTLFELLEEELLYNDPEWFYNKTQPENYGFENRNKHTPRISSLEMKHRRRSNSNA
eukprot:TRINITY_DN1635_c0_g1_i3.p1 TRINITY_DN1635_c0_g1~~TRINITY_DN1635_c0_g1_i3.p1  ORF type:complete len:321 (-),score=59.72 TRINITY_DN1635_c0_g1_i3:1053-2015(-)